jgi:hypothetical protein
LNRGIYQNTGENTKRGPPIRKCFNEQQIVVAIELEFAPDIAQSRRRDAEQGLRSSPASPSFPSKTSAV